MCTVSWLHQPDGLHLLCNRDEKRDRELASPPVINEIDGVRFIMPRDGRAGGSWIAANEAGLAVTLLNQYNSRLPDTPPYPSRGQLVLSLMCCRSVEEAAARLRKLDIRVFRPFKLLAFERDAIPLRGTWTGETFLLERLDNMCPQTSSSFRTREVIDSRKQRYTNLRKRNGGELTLDLLQQYHRGHHPKRGAYSVCMHRPDACTVSFTHVVLGSDETTLQYSPQSPCQGLAFTELSLPVVELSRA